MHRWWLIGIAQQPDLIMETGYDAIQWVTLLDAINIRYCATTFMDMTYLRWCNQHRVWCNPVSHLGKHFQISDLNKNNKKKKNKNLKQWKLKRPPLREGPNFSFFIGTFNNICICLTSCAWEKWLKRLGENYRIRHLHVAMIKGI